MKQHFFFAFIALAMLACNQSTTADKERTGSMAPVTDNDSVATNMQYAYTIEHPDNWIPGDPNNTKIVLQSLKDYENGNVDETVKAFADTVDFRGDGFIARMSNDSLRSFFKQGRSTYKSFKVEMNDWESVKSKDGTEEYVSLWYKQSWENTNGMKDSVYVMDDLKMKNGKITELDEKVRHYPKSHANK